VTDLPDPRSAVRAEAVPDEAIVVVRGGPDSLTKLRAHA
jgi:hypothetical protein